MIHVASNVSNVITKKFRTNTKMFVFNVKNFISLSLIISTVNSLSLSVLLLLIMINNVSLLFHKTWTGAIVLLAILKYNVLNVKKILSFQVIRNNATKDLVIQSKIAINAHSL